MSAEDAQIGNSTFHASDSAASVGQAVDCAAGANALDLTGAPVACDAAPLLARRDSPTLTDVAVLALLEATTTRVGARGRAIDLLARQLVDTVGELIAEWAALTRAARAYHDAVSLLPSRSLTPQQFRVVYLAALDCDNTQTAVHLGVDVVTVRTHWRRAYRTLGVHSRAGAVGRLFGCPRSGAFLPPDG